MIFPLPKPKPSFTRGRSVFFEGPKCQKGPKWPKWSGPKWPIPLRTTWHNLLPYKSQSPYQFLIQSLLLYLYIASRHVPSMTIFTQIALVHLSFTFLSFHFTLLVATTFPAQASLTRHPICTVSYSPNQCSR